MSDPELEPEPIPCGLCHRSTMPKDLKPAWTTVYGPEGPGVEDCMLICRWCLAEPEEDSSGTSPHP